MIARLILFFKFVVAIILSILYEIAVHCIREVIISIARGILFILGIFVILI
jgi:hypothetical protein